MSQIHIVHMSNMARCGLAWLLMKMCFEDVMSCVLSVLLMYTCIRQTPLATESYLAVFSILCHDCHIFKTPCSSFSTFYIVDVRNTSQM